MPHLLRLLIAAFIALVLMPASAAAERPELAYLEQVNAWRPPSDPQLLFLLMGQYANAGRHLQGAAYLDELRRRFDAQLDDTQRALYLTAIASLRAGGAAEVFLLRRVGWVRDTLAMLDEAQRLTQGQAFITHWMSGIVRARLPAMFGERDRAERDLRWCLQNPGRMPHPGWLREVHYALAGLLRQRGEVAQADHALAASGFSALDKPATFTTPFTHDPLNGHRFAGPHIRELVPDTVYLVSGHDFTEYYFVVSADRRELMAIDAGTSAGAARRAHEALRAHLRQLPPLTTVFITHAHWDHVGGQRYFRSLKPTPRFIGRGNHGRELAHNAGVPVAVLTRFFGSGFRLQDVLDYRPDTTIDERTELVVGGTRFVLWPTRGGETEDAMLIHLPEPDVLFAGDALMPYLGAPFVEEGSADGLLAAIDQVAGLGPRQLLHGHEPLNRIFNSVDVLRDLRMHLAWLRDAVRQSVTRGMDRATLQQANLVPPGLDGSSSAVHLAYLVIRENMINRVFDQHSGYWQNGLQGLDALTDHDHGTALVDYLGISASRIGAAAERMMADGRHDLAAATLRGARARLPDNERLSALQRLAYLRLAEQYQEFHPFKYILYLEQADPAAAPAPASP